jgi:CBS domain-containing protein
MHQLPLARDVMTAWPLVLDPEIEVTVAIEKLVSSGVSGAAVIDAGQILVGVLTEKDCLRILAHVAFGEQTGGLVRDHMSTLKAEVAPTMDLVAVAHVFLRGNFPVLPVVDRGRSVGRIRRIDLVSALHELLERRASNRDPALDRPASIDELQRQTAQTTPGELAVYLRSRHQG